MTAAAPLARTVSHGPAALAAALRRAPAALAARARADLAWLLERGGRVETATAAALLAVAGALRLVGWQGPAIACLEWSVLWFWIARVNIRSERRMALGRRDVEAQAWLIYLESQEFRPALRQPAGDVDDWRDGYG